MYINLWYVAAFSGEVDSSPVKTRMLSRDFVLYRDPQRRVLCLSNVCPHRGASLAQGKCHENGGIACSQHGWRFDADGYCRFVPSQRPETRVPAGLAVDSYPTHEENGLIWVFLGDRPERSPPRPPMPECTLPGWRTLTFGETWHCNFHWAKFSNLDLTHVPIVHGQNFVGHFTPSEEIVQADDYTIASRVVTPFEQPTGNWQALRERARNIVSTLTFYAAGFTCKGHLEIGGEGSGIFATFYEMATPIDAETTQMRYLFIRNFMAEPEHDEGYLKRNLKNLREDRLIAEAQLPKRGPSLPSAQDILLDPDDTLVRGYWEIMARLRAAKCEIDLTALDLADRGHRYVAIPSPLRQRLERPMVHAAVPTV